MVGQKRHFAVVARPWGEQRTGHRSFYVDEQDVVLVSEGVADVHGGVAPRLPEFHLHQSKRFDLGGLRWRSLEIAQSP